MNRKDIIYYLSLTTIISFFFLMVYLVYLTSFDGNNAISYEDKLMPATVVDNEYVDVTVSYCKEREIPFVSRVSFTNGVVYSLPEETVSGAPVGCRDVHKRFNIPFKLPSGRYQLNVQNTMEVNKLRRITASYMTDFFVIEEREVN